jgi:hypothetical protein
VPETAHDQLEKGADVVVRFTDEHAGHGARIGDRRRDCTIGMV